MTVVTSKLNYKLKQIHTLCHEATRLVDDDVGVLFVTEIIRHL